MASFLKGLRGNGETSELRELADRINGERQTLEHLLSRAEGSSRQLGKLTEPIPKLSDRLAALERQVNSIEERASVIAVIQNQTEALLDTHRELEGKLAESRNEMARITSELGELGRLVTVATGLKRELGEFCEFEGPFRALKGDAEMLKVGMAELAEGYRGLRENRDELAQTTTQATSRLAAIEQTSQATMRDLENHARRMEEVEQGIARLAQVAAGASDTKHQLLMLKSLADQVTQKTAALENQRDAVERAARDVSRLDDLMHQVDAAIREQENQISKVHTLTTDVGDLQSVYESVETRSKAIGAQQQQIEERERATRQRLVELAEQVSTASERFDLERRGLETVSHRVTDLKAALTACEEHMRRLDASSRAMSEVEAKVDSAWTRLGSFMIELEKMNELPERMRIIRADANRLHELMQEMSARSAELERAKPVVEAAVRDLAGLSRSHEAVKDALDQMGVAQNEMALVRNTLAGTDTWLKTVQESVSDLQGRVMQLDAARPTVECVQRDVQRVLEATEVVASRRQFLDDVQSRLAELASLAAQFDDRTNVFRSRLDVAEGRFISVTKQAEETERISGLVSRVSATVAQADDRVANLTRSIASLESRSQNLESIAERARLLGVELEQRQSALEKASEHLARASMLRQEAAEAVQQLDERTLSLQSTLGGVETRAKRLELLSVEYDTYCGKIRSVEAGMADFSMQLGKWEIAKFDLRQSLDQVVKRQSTVDALRASINEMFEMAERTANDVKAAADAHREIRDSRASLDELLRRLHEADGVTAGLELRKQEIEQAEHRLARAQALLIDIQSSLEMLNNQKALLDHVIEQAGSLTFQIQQAEALIDRLRKERDITNAVRTALEDSAVRAPRPKRET